MGDKAISIDGVDYEMKQGKDGRVILRRYNETSKMWVVIKTHPVGSDFKIEGDIMDVLIAKYLKSL